MFCILKDLRKGVTQTLLLMQGEIKLKLIVCSDILSGSYRGSAAFSSVMLQSTVHTMAEFTAGYPSIMAHY